MKKNDTNRLANRGGALLKEEKIRKGISKELPKVKIVYKLLRIDIRAYFVVNVIWGFVVVFG